MCPNCSTHSGGAPQPLRLQLQHVLLPSACAEFAHLVPLVPQDEFKSLFELLDLDITENQKENLFAFCDADCSGEISEKEFQEGWEMMVDVSKLVSK